MNAVLIITNSEDETANYVCSKLKGESLPFFRIDTDSLLNDGVFRFTPAQPEIIIGGHRLSPSEISAVWLRRPLPLESHEPPTAESNHLALEWSEAFEGFLAHIGVERWINHPTRNVVASHKLEQLTRAATFGLRVPDTLLTQNKSEALAFLTAHPEGIIAKPLAAGYLERQDPQEDTLIYTNEIHSGHLTDSFLLYRCPTLFQSKIQKKKDLRVVYVDGDLSITALTAFDGEGEQRLDIRRKNMSDVSYSEATISAIEVNAIRGLILSYGLRFAAIDFVVDVDDRLFFLEINPNGQWAWLDFKANTRIAASLIKAFNVYG